MTRLWALENEVRQKRREDYDASGHGIHEQDGARRWRCCCTRRTVRMPTLALEARTCALASNMPLLALAC